MAETLETLLVEIVGADKDIQQTMDRVKASSVEMQQEVEAALSNTTQAYSELMEAAIKGAEEAAAAQQNYINALNEVQQLGERIAEDEVWDSVSNDAMNAADVVDREFSSALEEAISLQKEAEAASVEWDGAINEMIESTDAFDNAFGNTLTEAIDLQKKHEAEIQKTAKGMSFLGMNWKKLLQIGIGVSAFTQLVKIAGAFRQAITDTIFETKKLEQALERVAAGRKEQQYRSDQEFKSFQQELGLLEGPEKDQALRARLKQEEGAVGFSEIDVKNKQKDLRRLQDEQGIFGSAREGMLGNEEIEQAKRELKMAEEELDRARSRRDQLKSEVRGDEIAATLEERAALERAQEEWDQASLEATEKKMELDKVIHERIQQLQDENRAMSEGSEGQLGIDMELKRFKEAGASDDQLQVLGMELKRQQEITAEQEHQNKLEEQAKQLIQESLTPLQEFEQSYQELSKLFSKGLIDEQTFNDQLNKLDAEFKSKSGFGDRRRSAEGVQAVDARSSGFRALAFAQSQNRGGNTPEERAAKGIEALVELERNKKQVELVPSGLVQQA